MTVSIRTLCRMALAAAGLVLGSQAHAASVTVNAGAACTAFTWDQASSTLTCQVTTDCVITGATSAAPGTPVVLTASCPTSTSITWSGGSCAGVTGATCTANEASTGNVTYTADGNSSAPDTHAVNWTNTTVAPGGCTLTANPTSGPSGTNVGLTANCTSGTNPINIAWGGSSGTSGCPTSFSVGSPATCTVSNVTANATWTASFSNGQNFANNPRQASFAVQSGGGGGNFAGCPSDAIKIDGQWGNLAIWTGDYGTFGGNMVSVRIAVPSSWTSGSTKTTSWAEFVDSGTYREAVLSTAACDFGTANALKTSGGVPARSVDTLQFSFRYKTGAPTSTIFSFTPGNVYYLNIRNYYSYGALACTSGSCAMRGGLPN